MELVYKRNKNKKHTCHTCDKQFNWNKNSWRYGNHEGSDNDPVFCSDKCKDVWIEKNKS